MRIRQPKVVPALLLAGALAASIAGGPASARLTSSCSGTYISNEDCQFFLAGPHLVVYVFSFAGASVAIRDPLGNLLLGCTSIRGACSAEAYETPAAPGPTVSMLSGVPLTCEVSGGSGSYFCSSETG